MLICQDGDHDPPLCWYMPKHFRVSKLARADGDQRVARVFGPCPPMVCAVGEVLGLFFRSVLRVDGDKRRLTVYTQAAGVLPIHHRAAGEDHDPVFFVERDRQMFPTEDVTADGVTPTHVSPHIA